MVFCSILAWPVGAQTTIPSFSINSSADTAATEVRFGPNSCGNDFAYVYRMSVAIQVCTGNVLVWATTGACGDRPGSADLSLVNRATGDLMLVPFTGGFRTVSSTVRLSRLPAFGSADGGAPCGDLPGEISMSLCGSVPTGANACLSVAPTNTAATPLKVIYDNKPPDAPQITDVEAIDSALKVSFTLADSDIATVVPQFLALSSQDSGAVDADAGNYTVVTASGSTGSATILTVKGLKNGVPYAIQLVATDTAGNVSAPSTAANGTPILTEGFLGGLNGGGQYEPSGCSATNGAFGLLAFAMLVGARSAAQKRESSRDSSKGKLS